MRGKFEHSKMPRTGHKKQITTSNLRRLKGAKDGVEWFAAEG